MILQKIQEFAIKSKLGLVLACSFLFFSCSKDKTTTQVLEAAKNKESNTTLMRNGGNSYKAIELFKGIMFMSGPVANEIPEIKEQVELIKILNPTQENQNELSRMQENFINQVEIENPGYINSFAESIKSQDQQRIKDELNRAQDVIFNAISKYFHFENNTTLSAKEQVLNLFKTKQEEIEGLIAELQLNQITKDEFVNSIKNTLQLDNTQMQTLAESAGSNPDSQLFGGCVAFLSFVGCNVAVAINIAGYVNVALAAAVAVAAAAWVFTYKWTWNGNQSRNYNQLDYDKYINTIAITF